MKSKAVIVQQIERNRQQC